ncbi:caspase family protein [Longispora sp. NPDC051575]|uniref:caspase family protein n=1 Tax=Longispora sp. NPDC051575 TaxID=3154943 RepID=UPI0034314010
MMTLADPSKSRAVLVGTASYDHLQDLPAVANNLARLKELFTDPEVWGLNPEHCVVLLDPTRDGVLEAIGSAADSATDTLVIYFAGHGIPDSRSQELHLALPTTTPDRLFRAVSYGDVRRAVLDSRSANKVVLLDCCYSGRAMAAGMGTAEAGMEVGIDGAYLMTASAATRTSSAPIGATYTAFTGEVIAALADGLPTDADVLYMEDIYFHVHKELAAKGLPKPQQMLSNGGRSIAVARNRFAQPAKFDGVDWAQLSPTTRRNFVATLIATLNADSQVTQPADDDSVIVTCGLPDARVAYHVFPYVESVTSAQKRTIRRSLADPAAAGAARHVVVTPHEPSPAERSWLESAAPQNEGEAIEWLGTVWLDDHLTDQQDLCDYFLGTGPRRHATPRSRSIGDLLAPMTTINDLQRELTRLRTETRKLSPLWRIDHATQGPTTQFTIRERFAGAAVLDPVTITPVFSFPLDDPDGQDAHREFLRAIDFGSDATIDGRFIDRFEFQASEQTLRLLGADKPTKPAQIQIKAIPNNEGLPLPCVLEAVDAQGVILARLDASLTERTGGRRGTMLTGSDPSGMLSFRNTLEHLRGDKELVGRMNFTVHGVVDRYPYACRPAADFLLAMTPGTKVLLRIGEAVLGPGDVKDSLPQDMAQPARLVVALHEVQRQFGRQLPIPDGLTGKDLREIEMVAELANAGEARWPYRGINTGIWAHRLQEFLDDERIGSHGALILESDRMPFTWGGQTIDIGPFRLYGSHMTLTNRPELETAVGTGQDPEARWRCMDGHHLTIFRKAPAERGKTTDDAV